MKCPTDEVWVAYGVCPDGTEVWSYSIYEEGAMIRLRAEYRHAELKGTSLFTRTRDVPQEAD